MGIYSVFYLTILLSSALPFVVSLGVACVLSACLSVYVCVLGLALFDWTTKYQKQTEKDRKERGEREDNSRSD